MLLSSLIIFNSCDVYTPLITPLPDTSRMLRQSELMQKLMKEPDTPQWYRQREDITLAMGDRVFDKNFDRVFDSLIIAIANLGAHVGNMERQSGYISVSGTLLSPEIFSQLRHEGLVEYCQYYGYDPDLLQRKGEYNIDPDMTGGMIANMMQAMTITVVKEGENQTKVKLRFANVYYPRLIEEYYKAVWPALDKQIFMDKNLD